jgi:hypothetical protein
MLKHIISAASLVILQCGTSFADDPQGVAFVEAPEQSSGVCFGENADTTFSCAKQKCTENGTAASDCLRIQWCYPSGWSADIFMQHKEGQHWHRYLCGWQSRDDLEQAAKIACEGSLKEELIECAVVAIWDYRGKAIKLDEAGQN